MRDRFPFLVDLDANSLSGLFMQRLLRALAVKDRVDDVGCRMTVLSLHGRRVGRASIEKLAPGPTESVQDLHIGHQ